MSEPTYGVWILTIDLDEDSLPIYPFTDILYAKKFIQAELNRLGIAYRVTFNQEKTVYHYLRADGDTAGGCATISFHPLNPTEV